MYLSVNAEFLYADISSVNYEFANWLLKCVRNVPIRFNIVLFEFH